MTIALTPLQLSLLVHACTCTGPPPHRGRPEVEDAVRQLTRLGAVSLGLQADCLTASQMGHAWLQALCAVQPPRRAWVNQEGAVVAMGEDA